MSAEEQRKEGHLLLLKDASFLEEPQSSIYRVTNSGQDFLEAVRSETIWRKTKTGAAEVGGLTVGMMKDLAISYIKQEVTEKLGVKL